MGSCLSDLRACLCVTSGTVAGARLTSARRAAAAAAAAVQEAGPRRRGTDRLTGGRLGAMECGPGTGVRGPRR